MLNETEQHLRDSAESFERGGASADEAQAAAIAAYGDAPTIATASNRRSLGALLTAFVRAGAQLAVYGFAAIGFAALLARGLAALTSTQWVYGAPAGYRFTAAQCAHWLAVQPSADTCRTAAALESSDDSFVLVLGAAVIGLIVAGLVLGAIRLARRPRRPIARLPRTVVAAIGATAFLGAGAALVAAASGNGVARGVWGQGVLSVDGAVALAFGIVFLVRFLLTIRPVSTAAA
jgi:hypothetical protein